MGNQTGLERLKHLAAYINMVPGPGRAQRIQASLLGLKRYLQELEDSTANVDVTELKALRQQVKTLKLIETDKDIRILDLEEVQEKLRVELRETKQSLANERRNTTRLTKRIEDAKPRSKRNRNKQESD